MVNYIDEIFIDEQLSKDIHRILDNNYSRIFSDLEGTIYRISDNNARSIRNPHGKYRTIFDRTTYVLNEPPATNPITNRISPYDDFHKQATMAYLHIYCGGGIQKLVNELEKVLRMVNQEDGMWNGVKYHYQKLVNG